ncbi:MAG: lytic transglycosylase domain-containing protein [Ignavibacteriaceae bacterium]|nr:lytic transglycosylase domain-containing protein [Ignavibacteriaceae bacterium]
MKTLRQIITTSRPNFVLFFSGMGIGILLLVVIGIYSSNQGAGANSQKIVAVQDTGAVYRVSVPKITNNLEFAGERVPVENFEVKERIEREFLVNTYWYSATLLGIKRANRWFPVIEPILQKYKIPDDFKYVPVIESNLYNSVSQASAVGFWQLTEDVARKYGLEVDEEVDERYNVEKSTEAACQYLIDAYGIFKSWTLVAASYNMGKNGLQKQIEKQKVKNYYNLLLSDETSRYVARLIAMKEIFLRPEKYGYNIKNEELYPPLKTTNVEVNSSIANLTDFAFAHEINYKILKYYNPWLRDVTLINKKKKAYEIKIPVKGSMEMIKEE